jgi:tetratricopeptide (TPR) repeat protein
MKKIFLILVILLCFPLFSFAETIVLKSGKIIEGNIIEKKDKYIIVNLGGKSAAYFFSEIDHIIEEKQQRFSKPLVSLEQIEKSVVYLFGEGSDLGENLQGTGFIVGSEGIIITTCHGLSSSKYVQVKLWDDRSFPIESVIYYDVQKDFCILKINARELPYFQLSDSDKINLRDKVLVVGTPGNKINVLSDSFISRVVDWSSFGKFLEIYTSADYSGYSGGPVLNLNGEVVGTVVSQLSEAGRVLAINEIKPFIFNKTKLSWAEFIKEKPAKSMSLYFKAQYCQMQGNLRCAIDSYNKAIELYPNNPMAFYNLGEAYIKNKELDNAIRSYQAAIKINPNFAEAYNNLSVAYWANGELQKAIQSALRALEIKPNHIPACKILADIYKRIGNDEQANYYRRKLRELGKDSKNDI